MAQKLASNGLNHFDLGHFCKSSLILFAAVVSACDHSSERLDIIPGSLSAVSGSEVVIHVAMVSNDGTRRDVTDSVTWYIDEPNVVSIGDNTRLVSHQPGLSGLTARFGNLEAHALIGVVATESVGPLRRSRDQSRYFDDASGNPVFLTGSHTWSNFQDNGQSFPPPRFDFDSYLGLLSRNNHNFLRLWRWEQSNWMTQIEGNFWFFPQPYKRTGPGYALDGRLKYDLSKFDDVYFTRLRSRIRQARDHGIYVSVMLFDGWSLEPKGEGLGNPWAGHPLNKDNNINGIDGDLNEDNKGIETHSLAIADVVEIHKEYVRQVYESIADLDNVIFEVSNESRTGSISWQNEIVEFLHSLANEQGKWALVGITVERPGPSNEVLFNSMADWVSPFRNSSRPLDPITYFSDKVVIHDTDHVCGVCGDVDWVWKATTRGLNPILMDYYDTTASSIGRASLHMADNDWESVRRNMGYARIIAEQINLRFVEPVGGLASTGYCLANIREDPHEYLVFVPAGSDSVTLDMRSSTGHFSVDWLSTDNGQLIRKNPILAGKKVRLDKPTTTSAALILTSVAPSR